MADKSVTMFVVDLGSSMGECSNGRMESDLDFGMRYIWDKIAKIMVADKISWQVGVIGFRTDDTKNTLSEDDDYENISVLKDIGPMKMNDLAPLRKMIQPSETEAGDVISAIVLAIHLITEATTLKSKKLGKYIRKIFVLTNGQGSIEDDRLKAIAQRITETEIELIVIGIDFDDAEYGYKEEDKSSTKRRTEKLLGELADSCFGKDGEPNGILGTAAQAIEQMAVPELKKTKPYTTFTGRLELGDPNEYPETALYIDVKRFFKTKPAKTATASAFVSRTAVGDTAQSSSTLQEDTEMTDAPSNEMLRVRNLRTYEVTDASGVGGKRDIDREELAKGYEYGRTVVPMEAANEITTKFETIQNFSIIGFIPWNKYERYLNMGDSCVTIALPTNEKARLAMSSLVRALHALESYAVARIVLKDGKSPQIILLAPSIEIDLECLIDVPLPFAEDIRIYRFPPLDRIISLSGKTITTHRLLPSEDLDEAMSDYVDSMDLSKFGTDDDGNPDEYMKIEDTFSPVIHRVNQAICQRAVHPGEAVSPPADILTKWSNPPKELTSKAMPELKKLIKIADVQKVPPRVKGKKNKDAIVPLSGLDIEGLLSKAPRITRENAIPEFKQMIRSTTDDNVIADATRQMGTIIQDLIKNSTGNSHYEQATANMKVFRRLMIEYEMSNLYNDFLRALKEKLASSEIDQRAFWPFFRLQKLGLIDNEVVETSDVTVEEAREFMKFKGSESQLPTRGR